MKTNNEIFKAIEGLYIAAKYKDDVIVQMYIKICDDLNITNYAQNICFRRAANDKTAGTSSNVISSIIKEAGDRLIGRSSLYNTVLVV